MFPSDYKCLHVVILPIELYTYSRELPNLPSLVVFMPKIVQTAVILFGVHTGFAEGSCDAADMVAWGSAPMDAITMAVQSAAGTNNYAGNLTGNPALDYASVSAPCSTCTFDYLATLGQDCFVRCLIEDAGCFACKDLMQSGWNTTCNAIFFSSGVDNGTSGNETTPGNSAQHSFGFPLTMALSVLTIFAITL